jgi:hypothetical protein
MKNHRMGVVFGIILVTLVEVLNACAGSNQIGYPCDYNNYNALSAT